MAEYEMVREIKNLCPNNQMRDIFFEEVETDDPVEYVRNYLKGKAANKAALQRELGLAEDPDALLVGMVSRLTFQKGTDLGSEFSH